MRSDKIIREDLEEKRGKQFRILGQVLEHVTLDLTIFLVTFNCALREAL